MDINIGVGPQQSIIDKSSALYSHQFPLLNLSAKKFHKQIITAVVCQDQDPYIINLEI